jgi:hypothetical protein
LEAAGLAVEVQDRAGRQSSAINSDGIEGEHLAPGVGFDPEGDTPLICSKG